MCIRHVDIDNPRGTSSAAERGLEVRTPHLHYQWTEAIPGSIPGVLIFFNTQTDLEGNVCTPICHGNNFTHRPSSCLVSFID